jgi:hypothetical protein
MRNRFWHFVQNFWQYDGSFDITDDWCINYNVSFAYLSSKQNPFKTSFPYKLTLSRRKKGYLLSVAVEFNTTQTETIDNCVKVYSKKEAIRKALQVIKQFENSEKIKDVWLRLRKKIPIVNSKGQWIASVILGNVNFV